MAGQEWLHCENLQADMVDNLHDKTRVEHMLMQAPILEISHRPVPEFLECACTLIPAQIVTREDFRQVSQISFSRLAPIVLHQVFQCSHRPAVIKRSILVRDDKHEETAYPKHANPLAKSPQGVRQMFDAMRRENEVVLGIPDLA